MIQPTFSRILRKLLWSLFGSPLWHPGVGIAYDTQAGHDVGVKQKQAVAVCAKQHGAASLRAASEQSRMEVDCWPLEKEAKHLGVLTTV